MEEMKNKENTYEILTRNHFNENRLFYDRTSMYLLMSTILFLGFVYIPPTAKELATTVCVLGMIASVAIFVSLRTSIKTISFWHDALQKIEEEEQGTFAYMRERKVSPHIHGWQVWDYGKLAGIWKSAPWTASFFFILWTAALIHVWYWS